MKKKITTFFFLFLMIFSSATSSFATSLSASTSNNEIQNEMIIIENWYPNEGIQYSVGDIVTDGVVVKEVIQDFTSNGDDELFEDDSLFGEGIPYEEASEAIDNINMQLEDGVTYNYSNKSRAVISLGAMIIFLKGSWNVCTTVARGMGMPGCFSVIRSSYSVVRQVYDRVR